LCKNSSVLNLPKEIAKVPGAKRGPILILTNLNREHIIEKAFKIGADGYVIQSEVTPDKIVGEVTNALNKA
jgi:DNA-binding NarL/FixJ family response regulator